jgi:TrmH family RNA methyltransferase
MGTLAFIPIHFIGDDELEKMLGCGYELCATVLGGENLFHTRFGGKNILAVGSEAHGLCSQLIDCSGKKVTIPLEPACESLNAAVAGSICLFQIKCGA